MSTVTNIVSNKSSSQSVMQAGTVNIATVASPTTPTINIGNNASATNATINIANNSGNAGSFNLFNNGGSDAYVINLGPNSNSPNASSQILGVAGTVELRAGNNATFKSLGGDVYVNRSAGGGHIYIGHVPVSGMYEIHIDQSSNLYLSEDANSGTSVFIGSATFNAVKRSVIIGSTNTSSDTNIRAGTGRVNITSPTATVFSSSLSTAPVASHTATTAFGSSLTAGTALQNTTGYNLLVNVCVDVSSATGATLTLGVGSTSTPTGDTVVSSFTVAASTLYNFSAIVPNQYYILVNTTGTISVSSIGIQSCPL